MSYAKELTRDYLKSLGVTHVSSTGEVFKNDVKLNQHFDGNYFLVTLYDPELRQSIPLEERTKTSGNINFGVHRLCYAWWNGSVPENMVVDHIDNNKTNNNIFNLQLLTPGENVWKERECNKYEMKCKLTRPRSFYSDKLSNYCAKYAEAKQAGDTELCHKLRTNIAQTRARLRYYDSHIDEALKLAEQKKQEETNAKLKKEYIEARNKAAYVKEYHKSNNNKLWHTWAQLSRQKTFTTDELYKIDAIYYYITNKQ